MVQSINSGKAEGAGDTDEERNPLIKVDCGEKVIVENNWLIRKDKKR